MSTYTLISSQVLGSSAASVTFSSIPQTYKDLVLKTSVRTDLSSSARTNLRLTFNGLTTGYSETYLLGYDSSTLSSNNTGVAWFYHEYVEGAPATSNTFSSGELYVPNYAGSTYKPMSLNSLAENNSTTGWGNYIKAFLLSNTAAIASLTLTAASGVNILANSSFYLYGI